MNKKDAPISVIIRLLKGNGYGADNMKGNWERTFNAEA